MTHPQLAAMKARAEAAPKGPWYLEVDGWPVRDVEPGKGSVPFYADGIDDSLGNPYRPYEFSPAAMEFIAHARTDVPKLVTCLEAVIAKCEKYRYTSTPLDPDQILDIINRELRKE